MLSVRTGVGPLHGMAKRNSNIKGLTPGNGTRVKHKPAGGNPAGHKQAFYLSLLLFSVTLWTFFPSYHNDFVNFDDDVYVSQNAHVQGGLTWESIQWAFHNAESGNWHPLTWLSHMLYCQLFGLNPAGHHLTSVLIHALNTSLLFLALTALTGATWRSFFVAALFGLHPLRVESVAWVAERKDVLSTFFWMLALWAYAMYAGKSKPLPCAKANAFYAIALALFALGLMCKSMLVTVPFTLLLLDYWPLDRWRPGKIRFLVMEKAPFFLLAAIVSAITLISQRSAGAVQTLDRLPLPARIENALVSYCRYLEKVFWPVNLAVDYPPVDHWPAAVMALAALVLAGICVLAWAMRRERPYLIVGWLWFLGTLVPVIGIVQVGWQSMADRYSYVPSIGLLLILVWGSRELPGRWRGQAVTLPIVASVAIIFLMTVTRVQIGYWKDTESLFRHAIAVTENNVPAYLHLGSELARSRRLDEAISMCQEAVRLKPAFGEAHSQLGNALYMKGLHEEGVSQLEEAIRLQPSYAQAHFNLGVALVARGGLDEAISQFQEALKCNPSYGEAHSALGVALENKGRLDEGIFQFEEAIRLKPDYAPAHCNLGVALSAKGRREEAISHLRQALKLWPNYPAAEQQLRALTGSGPP